MEAIGDLKPPPRTALPACHVGNTTDYYYSWVESFLAGQAIPLIPTHFSVPWSVVCLIRASCLDR